MIPFSVENHENSNNFLKSKTLLQSLCFKRERLEKKKKEAKEGRRKSVV
jgi:hypothetical protein